jgi:hypothetical protein
MRLDPIFAYLDPTTGSIGYQVAISGFLTALATCRIYWQRIQRVFQKGRGPQLVDKVERTEDSDV